MEHVMGARLRKAWSGWLGWVAIAALGAAYFALHMIGVDEDRDEARGARIRQEVSETVGADLRAKSAARHQKLMEQIKSGALLKTPPKGPPSGAAATDAESKEGLR